MRNKLTLVTGIGGDKQAGRLGIMTVVACGDDGGSDEQHEEGEKAMMKFMSLTLGYLPPSPTPRNHFPSFLSFGNLRFEWPTRRVKEWEEQSLYRSVDCFRVPLKCPPRPPPGLTAMDLQQ